MIKPKHLDQFIISLMFLLLLVDMLNGFLLHSGTVLPISIAQFFKLIITLLIFTRFLFNVKLLILSTIFFIILLIPSIIQVLYSFKVSFLFKDVIKISKYLMPLFSFLFFMSVFKNRNEFLIKKIFSLVKFSYYVFVFNILIKYLGFGYPMYPYADVGSKGFFYAGNETSVLLIILSGILAYEIWLSNNNKKYYLFMFFNIFVGLTIASKTGILGILLTFFLIPLKHPTFKIDLKKLINITTTFFLLAPLAMYGTWSLFKGSKSFLRAQYFWQKLDFVTFIFSNRNVFFSNAWIVYKKKYTFIEKLFGVGQTKYETLNNKGIIEIDIADFLFAYGILGLIIFIFTFIILLIINKKLINITNNTYAKFVFLMIFILLLISSIAGHVFSSGMSAIFIGLLFSLMYYKSNDCVS